MSENKLTVASEFLERMDVNRRYGKRDDFRDYTQFNSSFFKEIAAAIDMRTSSSPRSMDMSTFEDRLTYFVNELRLYLLSNFYAFHPCSYTRYSVRSSTFFTENCVEHIVNILLHSQVYSALKSEFQDMDRGVCLKVDSHGDWSDVRHEVLVDSIEEYILAITTHIAKSIADSWQYSYVNRCSKARSIVLKNDNDDIQALSSYTFGAIENTNARFAAANIKDVVYTGNDPIGNE